VFKQQAEGIFSDDTVELRKMPPPYDKANRHLSEPIFMRPTTTIFNRPEKRPHRLLFFMKQDNFYTLNIRLTILN